MTRRAGPGASRSLRPAAWLPVFLVAAVLLPAPPSVGGPLPCNLTLPCPEPPCVPPPPPTGLTAVQNETGILLSWQAPPTLAGGPVDTYNIYRANVSQGDPPRLLVALWDRTTYFDGNVTPGEAYAYSVSSVDGCEGPPSPPVLTGTPCDVVRPDDPLHGGIYLHPECVGP